jgi:light-regulated signal transduction histidine kinase (bacteriophytochrome)
MQEAINDLESFSYSISHDLKAPLRALKGYTGIIQEELADVENYDVSDAVESIKRNIEKMEKLISDIFHFSRVGKTVTNLKPVNFKQIFLDVYKELVKLEPLRTISFTVDEKIPLILFDPAMAKQLVQNLLSNAIKYTSKKDFAEIIVGIIKKGSERILFVRDNGAGFDETFKDKLFAVFQRLHSEKEFPGTGVGLAIVKRIIDKHGGRVWGEGITNKGATFYISLPKKSIYYENP